MASSGDPSLKDPNPAEFKKLKTELNYRPGQIDPKIPKWALAGNNKTKGNPNTHNRYHDVLVRWENRVVLSESQHGGEQSTFYNANYIANQITGDKQCYVAAMGPMEHQTARFNRLILETKAPVVVMVTGLVEKTKSKCARYWPEAVGETIEYGSGDEVVSSTKMNESQCDGYVKSRMSIEHKGKSHTYVHLWYNTWPDHGVPVDENRNFQTQTLLKMVADARDIRNGTNAEGITITHCSAGIGRTGTFILVDQVLSALNNGKSGIDLVKMVNTMRSEGRGGLVQTVDQYSFAHAACDAYLQTLRTRRFRELGVAEDVAMSSSGASIADVVPEEELVNSSIGRFNDWLEKKLKLIESGSRVMFSMDGSCTGQENATPVIKAIKIMGQRARNDLYFPRSDNFQAYQQHIASKSINRSAAIYFQKDLRVAWDAFIKDEEAAAKYMQTLIEEEIVDVAPAAEADERYTLHRRGSLAELPKVGSPVKAAPKNGNAAQGASQPASALKESEPVVFKPAGPRFADEVDPSLEALQSLMPPIEKAQHPMVKAASSERGTYKLIPDIARDSQVRNKRKGARVSKGGDLVPGHENLAPKAGNRAVVKLDSGELKLVQIQGAKGASACCFYESPGAGRKWLEDVDFSDHSRVFSDTEMAANPTVEKLLASN